MPYALYTLPAADRDFDRLPKQVQERIEDAFEKLKEDPYRPGATKGTGVEWHRYRVGSYRIIYYIDEKAEEIDVTAIKHRREAYR